MGKADNHQAWFDQPLKFFKSLVLRRITPWVAAPVALFLLIAHSLKWGTIRVDTTSIALLLVILLAPYMHLVRKLKVPGFEAEIAPEEVDRVRQEVEEKIPTPAPGAPDATPNESAILALVREHPALGLVLLRIELEKALRIFQKRSGIAQDSRRYPIHRMAYELEHSGKLPPGITGALRDLTPLLNRAAHGEHIRPDDAEELATLGIGVLEEIRHAYKKSFGEPLPDTLEATPNAQSTGA
jgi:hypothetical protein